MISPVSLLIEWEYVCRQSRSSCAMGGEVASRSGRILWWLHDVRILVFWGFMKHPRAFPRLSNSVKKKIMSWWWIIAEMSSMYAKICARLPNPLSPGLPLSSLSFARSFSLS